MTEASSELVIVCQCPGAVYMFEIVKKCKVSHPAQDQVVGDTHAEECHNAIQLTVHTIWNNLFDRNTSILYYRGSFILIEKRVHYTKIKNNISFTCTCLF